MWFLTKKTLPVKIFANNKEVDLNNYSDLQLAEICSAIIENWKTSSDSILLFDMDCYTRCYCFQQTKTYLEVVAFEKTNKNPRGRTRISMPETWIAKKKGIREPLIVPKVLIKSWPAVLEVEYG